MATASNTPLLLLLDSFLCQDNEQLENALSQVAHIPLPVVITVDNLPRVVMALVEDNPKLVSIPSEHDKSLPLHLAASIGNVDVADVLIAEYPDAVKTPNDKGKIPLHYAAREGRTDMVYFLLRSDPKTVSIRSKKHKLALHFACGEGHLHVVQELLRLDPETARLPSKKGKLPLHFAARWGHISVAKCLLELYPGAVSSQDWDGSLPLHDAAREGQVVMSMFLIDLWPKGLQTANLRGEIPLFAAVRSGNVSVVTCLLRGWHHGGKHVLQNVADGDAIEGWNWQVIELCLRGADSNFVGCNLLDIKTKCQCDQSCVVCVPASMERESSPRNKDDRKRSTSEIPSSKKRLRLSDSVKRESSHCCCPFFPLNAALRANVNPRVLQVVLDTAQQNLAHRDCVGALPIHIAASHVTHEESLRICLEALATPDALRVRDNRNRLPLHRALESKANFGFVKALVEVYPKSVIEAYQWDGSKAKIPLSLAMERDCDLNTIFFLLRQDPGLLNVLVEQT